jgi:hypothetical protein
MYGPDFQSGEIVNTDVHHDNVSAFEKAGWKVGELEGAKEAKDVATPDPKPAKAEKAEVEDEKKAKK